jgi:diketogulonate reductase-like aldo/keto reductase
MKRTASELQEDEKCGVVTLSRTGDKMPLVGLGTWKIPKDSTADVVHQSIKTGYRLLDCACDYGNEIEVGAGIKKALDDGTIERKELWVTGKLWNTFHEKEHVKEGCLKTLKDLGLEYLDLYLIHFPIALKYVPIADRYPPEWSYDPANPGCVFSNATVRETWEAMEELVSEGLVKNIGIANFNCALMQDLVKYAKVMPNVLQVEHHPYLQQPALLKFAKSHEISITAYSSFGGKSYWELNAETKKIQDLLTHDTITAIAQKHSKTTAQVLLRWSTQRQVAVIPKSSNEARLKENLSLSDFLLDEKDIQEITKLDEYRRFNNPGEFANYPIYD